MRNGKLPGQLTTVMPIINIRLLNGSVLFLVKTNCSFYRIGVYCSLSWLILYGSIRGAYGLTAGLFIILSKEIHAPQ
ncbi:MAG: hypothetical protein ACTTJ7_09190 [Treponema sp.]